MTGGISHVVGGGAGEGQRVWVGDFTPGSQGWGKRLGVSGGRPRRLPGPLALSLADG